MRVAICSSFVPFVNGGGRFIVDWLAQKLREYGHEVEPFFLPFDESDDILSQFAAYRMIDLAESADRLIAIRPPSYLIPHPNKVVWFIHHLRLFYDLWDTPYQPLSADPRHQALRHWIVQADQTALSEARLFTNSKVVGRRLKQFNGLDSEVLYPPLLAPERFVCEDYGDEVVYICRVEHHKRQHLLAEAFLHVKTPVRLRICGASTNPRYAEKLRQRVSARALREKVVFESRWITEDEKARILSRALAAAYLPLDEDSYGYPSLEASYAEKPILTTTDSGGVLELVEDGVNGRVVEPDPHALAEAIDQLYLDRARTRAMGRGARQRLADLNIHWDHVVSRLLA